MTALRLVPPPETSPFRAPRLLKSFPGILRSKPRPAGRSYLKQSRGKAHLDAVHSQVDRLARRVMSRTFTRPSNSSLCEHKSRKGKATHSRMCLECRACLLYTSDAADE